MRNTLRVVAGRHRGDAGSAFGVAEAHQLVERTTLLERRGELEILELDPDLGTGDLRQHTRMRARRADQLAIHDIGGATDIVERNRQLHSIHRALRVLLLRTLTTASFCKVTVTLPCSLSL